MLCAPLWQVLLVAGGVIGTAIVAGWRETVAVRRDLAAANERIKALGSRVDALERKE